jgi:hypothetical protein
MAFVLELWAFLRARKKFWLLPVIVMMAVFGGLVVLGKGSVIAPFLYTLF